MHLEMSPSFLSLLVAAVQISNVSSPIAVSSNPRTGLDPAKESELFKTASKGNYMLSENLFLLK